MERMHAMIVRDPAARPADDVRPLVEPADVDTPSPRDDEVLIAVDVCGVCRTDLDVAEGRVSAPRYPVIPGHQIVGRVARAAAAVRDVREGDRVGVAWIASACGHCRWCVRGEENLCPDFRSTGCDVAG